MLQLGKLFRSRKLVFAAVLVGFLAFSVPAFLVTSARDVEAKGCGCACVCTVCTMTGVGAGASLGSVWSAFLAPSLATTTAMISAYFTATTAAVTALVVSEISTAQSNFIEFMDALWFYDLRPTLQDMTAQMSTMTSEQTREILSFGDANEHNLTLEQHMDEELESRWAHTPGENVCVAATGLGGALRSNEIKEAYGRAAPRAEVARSGGATGASSAAGEVSDENARWSDYIANYCNPQDNRGTVCPGTAGTRPDEDLQVTKLIFEKPTIDLRNPETLEIKKDLLTNLIEPKVFNPVPAAALSSPTGQELILQRRAMMARRQAAWNAAEYVVARRAPGSQMAGELGAIRDAAGISPADMSDNPSYNELMRAMVTERFQSGEHGVDMVTEPENVTRELVIDTAFEVMQLSDYLDLYDRMSMVLAAQAANEINKRKVVVPK